jgi:succinate dehydrogenase/fumarate reductase-like Fe-S protein
VHQLVRKDFDGIKMHGTTVRKEKKPGLQFASHCRDLQCAECVSRTGWRTSSALTAGK